MPAASPPAARLNGWEKAGLVLVGLLVVGFGVLVEIRSAFQQSRKTDFGVYARAAWAVREGHDIYEVMDDNGWHYCYPPTFAVLMAPLADPVAFAPRAGYIPYEVGVAVWYALSVLVVGWSVHAMAKVVLPDAPRGSRRWWYARLVPVYVCVGGIGATITRGQVNVHVAALLVGMFAAAAAGRRFASGVWLAGAVALKVIPGFMILYPLVRRDLRPAGGLAAGLVVFLGLIPAAVWGVSGAVDMNRRVLDLVIRPGTTGGGDQTRAKELTDTVATDSQSFQAAIHGLMYPDRETRPLQASRGTKLAHWAIGGALTLVVCAAGFRRPDPLTRFPKKEGGTGQSPGVVTAGLPATGEIATANDLILFGCLCSLMMLLTPVSHMHYYALGLPLVAGVWLRALADRPGAAFAGAGTNLALAGWGVATGLPLFPGPVFERLRDNGFGTVATVLLMGLAVRMMTRPPAATAAEPARPLPRAA